MFSNAEQFTTATKALFESRIAAFHALGSKTIEGGRSLLVRLPRAKSTWYGMKELEYRWPTARGMLQDVVEGKKCST